MRDYVLVTAYQGRMEVITKRKGKRLARNIVNRAWREGIARAVNDRIAAKRGVLAIYAQSWFWEEWK